MLGQWKDLPGASSSCGCCQRGLGEVRATTATLMFVQSSLGSVSDQSRQTGHGSVDHMEEECSHPSSSRGLCCNGGHLFQIEEQFFCRESSWEVRYFHSDGTGKEGDFSTDSSCKKWPDSSCGEKVSTCKRCDSWFVASGS